MAHFGKSHGRFEHHQGDFLNPKFKKLIIEEATVIFINNFAFSPDLMFRITNELLQDLKHGTRIVTTKPYDFTRIFRVKNWNFAGLELTKRISRIDQLEVRFESKIWWFWPKIDGFWGEKAGKIEIFDQNLSILVSFYRKNAMKLEFSWEIVSFDLKWQFAFEFWDKI